MPLLGIFETIYAQSNQATGLPPKLKKNSVYIEFLGSSGAIYNISYDRIMKQKEEYKVSIAGGLQYFPFGTSIKEDWITSLTSQVNILRGNIHYFEMGIGAIYLLTMYNTQIVDGAWGIPLRFGYRYQKPEGGLLFKIAYTPLILNMEGLNGNILPIWGGVALGWTF